MIRTATVTWITFLNYGTFLQAYALQHVIRGMGFSNKIIDDKRIIDNKFPPAKRPKMGVCASVRHQLGKLYHAVKGDRVLQEKPVKLYQHFKDKYLNIDSDYDQFEDLNNRYDVFIAGSDQIWYPNAEIFDPYFYLDFVTKKMISYAPSVGASEYPKDYIEKTKPLLDRFEHISVREQKGQELLSSFLHKDISVVLDPTLLLTAKDWDAVASERLVKKRYAFLYMLTFNEIYIQYAQRAARVKGLQLVTVSNDLRLREYVDKIIPAGPSEFVSLIKYSDIVFTDSFHGTVFSILYHKEFVTFKRFKDVDKVNQNSRLYNLFNILEIKDRFISVIDKDKSSFEIIDYDNISSRLKDKIDISKSYLKNSIER